MTSADLRMGRWQDVLADVECDLLCPDPPYDSVTHDGHNQARTGDDRFRNAERRLRIDKRTGAVYSVGVNRRRAIDYASWTPADVWEFVTHWSPRTRGWMACMTSSNLTQAFREAYRSVGRLDFAPVPILQHRPRLTGDGPGSGAVYLMVARPRSRAFATWGSLPGWYHSQVAKDSVCGGKPVELLQQIIRDYSRPGDVVCDPCAGGGTTLLAALMEGRRAIGSECMPEHYEIARKRLAKGFTPPLFRDERPAPEQAPLFTAEEE